MNYPGICKELGIDPAQHCGPVMMQTGLFATREGNCCYNHPKGSPLHNLPVLKGKTFALEDYQERLEAKGLVVKKKELAAMKRKGDKPPGTPRKVGNALVYPVPHFG